MLQRNLGLKLISLLLAIFLWGYVTVEENPPESREIDAPVVLRHLPEDLTVLSKSSDSVRMTVHGLRRIVRGLTPGQVRMVGDLSALQVGAHTVRLMPEGLPRGVDLVSLSARVVQVTLDKVVEQTRSVTVKTKGHPAEGYILGPPEVHPAEVKVRAAASVLDQLSQVVAEVNVEGLSSSVEDTVPLQAVDQQGAALEEGTVDPGQVTVVLPLTKLPSKTVPIEPRIGQPPVGMRVASVLLKPTTVTISGDSQRLEQISGIRSAEVDISQLRGAKTYNAALEFPEGVRPVGVASVSVTVTVATGSGPETSTSPGEPGRPGVPPAEPGAPLAAGHAATPPAESRSPAATPQPGGRRHAPGAPVPAKPAP